MVLRCMNYSQSSFTLAVLWADTTMRTSETLMKTNGETLSIVYKKIAGILNDVSWSHRYNFNDSMVNPITEEEVRRAWGSSNARSSGYGSYSYGYTSSANAYMLMYRRISADNVKLPAEDEV